VTIVDSAPATYLLFLEKQLADLHTLIANLPVLDPARAWTLDVNSQLFKSEAIKTTRTRRCRSRSFSTRRPTSTRRRRR